MEWTTFQGERKELQTANHQDLSNFVFSNVLLLGGRLDMIKLVMNEITKRFDNKILPYRPHPLSHWEISTLIAKGFIYINDEGYTLIIVNRKVIGEVLKSNHPLYTKGW